MVQIILITISWKADVFQFSEPHFYWTVRNWTFVSKKVENTEIDIFPPEILKNMRTNIHALHIFMFLKSTNLYLKLYFTKKLKLVFIFNPKLLSHANLF